MKAKVIKTFSDKEKKCVHKVGDTIEVTKERYKEIQRFVEEIKEIKKTKKK